MTLPFCFIGHIDEIFYYWNKTNKSCMLSLFHKTPYHSRGFLGSRMADKMKFLFCRLIRDEIFKLDLIDFLKINYKFY